MIRCSHCQHENRSGLLARSEVSRCEACGSVLASTTLTHAPDSGRIHVRWVGVTFVLGLTALGVAGALRYRESVTLEASLTASLHQEFQTAEAGIQAQAEDWTRAEAEREAEQEQRALHSRVLTGEAARERRDREWALRQAQDPSLAVSPLELKLVQMRALGQSVELPDDQALLELARLAAPPGSRLEVVPEGDGYLLRVAFSMASMAPNESGATTRHRSVPALKQEVREMSARLVREVVGAGDTRRLRRLTVSCNRALRQNLIPSGATPEERAQLLAKAKVNMRRIYRMAIERSALAAVADWRTISLSRVLELMRVEHDEFQEIAIQSVGEGELPPVDPQQPLEF